MKARSCNYNESFAGCNSISERPAKPLTSVFGGQKLYAVKIKGTSFLETYKFQNGDGSCATGYMRCGNPQSTSKGVCIPASIGKCPITTLGSTSNGQDTELKFGPLSIFAGRSTLKNPIADLNITEDHLCKVRTYYPSSTNRPRYALLKGYGGDQCETDTEADKLNLAIGEKDLFDQNAVSYNGLWNYDVSNGYQYFLMGGRPLEWSPACAADVPDVISNSNKGDDLASQFALLYVLFIISFIVFVVSFCFFMGSLEDKCGKWASYVGCGLLIISVFLIFPSFCIVKSKVSGVSSDLSNLSTKGCSSPATNSYFKSIANSYDSKIGGITNAFFWTGMIAMWLALIGGVFYLVYFCKLDPNHMAEDSRGGNVYQELGPGRTPDVSPYGNVPPGWSQAGGSLPQNNPNGYTPGNA